VVDFEQRERHRNHLQCVDGAGHRGFIGGDGAPGFRPIRWNADRCDVQRKPDRFSSSPTQAGDLHLGDRRWHDFRVESRRDPTHAVIKVDRSQKPSPGNGAVYKGATIAEIEGKKFILAANFRSGRIEVFDTSFARLHVSEEAFDDDRIPRGFAPFNVQGIGPNIYVTYAKQDSMRHDDVPGAGLGVVAVFNPRGRLLAQLEHGPWLNAPWGVAMTPADFGEFSHTVLVGNFGSGTIAAFNPLTGDFMGNLLNPDGTRLTIDGLWGLAFGNGGASGPGNTLFFTAGPDEETNGLFGSLSPIPAELNENDEQ
jgi:uncharacterized protein (TIGR03118 family)